MIQKFCGKCGAKLVEGARFCGGCGAAIPQDASDNTYYNESMPDVSGKLRQSFDSYFKQEATGVLFNQPAVSQNTGSVSNSVKRGEIFLSPAEKKSGAVKVVDFGTGQRFSINIPPGMNGGDCIAVTDTGLKDPVFGTDCEIELIVV